MRKFIILVTALFLFFGKNFAQIEDQIDDPYRIVYWIRLTLIYAKDPNINAYRYKTQLLSKRVYSGTLDKFQHEIWKASSVGTYIPIGPFTYRQQAQFALKVFSKNADKNPQLLNDKGHYFWYLVRIGRYKRLNSYKFVHIPAAVAEGSMRDLLENMIAASYNESVLIGPFSRRIEAELSKRLYRREE